MSSSKSYKIAVIPGDGTGPEVIAEGLKVVKAVAAAESIKYDLVNYDLGGERYKKTGEILPDSVLEELKKSNAIYLGAIGHPDVKPGILEKGLLLRLRHRYFGRTERSFGVKQPAQRKQQQDSAHHRVEIPAGEPELRARRFPAVRDPPPWFVHAMVLRCGRKPGPRQRFPAESQHGAA